MCKHVILGIHFINLSYLFNEVSSLLVVNERGVVVIHLLECKTIAEVEPLLKCELITFQPTLIDKHLLSMLFKYGYMACDIWLRITYIARHLPVLLNIKQEIFYMYTTQTR